MIGASVLRQAPHCFLLFAVLACHDRTLNFFPDSPEPAAAGNSGSAGSTTLSAGGGIAVDAGGAGGSLSTGGEGGETGGSLSTGGAGGGTGGVAQGGSSAGDSASGAGGSRGAACQSDADCAPPTPGCSPTIHVCKRCSKSSQCPNGMVCDVADGECGN